MAAKSSARSDRVDMELDAAYVQSSKPQTHLSLLSLTSELTV